MMACSLARSGDWRQRGAVPLLTLLCLFGAPFWVRSNEEAGSSARRLRPPNPNSHSKAIRMNGPVSTPRNATGDEIALAPRAKIVVDFRADDCRRRDVQMARSVGRRGVRRQFGAMPLLASPCRFATPLWVGGNQDSYFSTAILRPSQSVSPPTVIRECGSVIAYRRPKCNRHSACPGRQDRRGCPRMLLSRTQQFEGVLASP